ncbi:MAG: hypothetical protein ACK5EQ_05950 [Bacteroidota bacterium]|jgi:hypothetical protein
MKRFLTFLFTSGLIAMVCLFLQTCKKDKVCRLDDKCENFPKPEGGISTIKQKNIQKHAPCFNPNNSNEIVYVKEENNKFQLIKFNIQSKVETVLLNNTNIVGQPKWGKNGWIAFISNDYQINLLKDDGSLNKKITSSNYYLYPAWVNDSSLSVEFSFNLGVPYFYCKINTNGLILDTIRNSSFRNGSVNSNNESAFQLYTANPSINLRLDKNVSQVIELENNGRFQITGIDWHPNNIDIYYSTYREGLFKVNKNSKIVTKIKCGCDSRSYRYLSISPDGSKIIVERVDATEYQNNTGSWTEEGKIIIMDIDGSNERNIFE